jgi:hypothetical protein
VLRRFGKSVPVKRGIVGVTAGLILAAGFMGVGYVGGQSGAGAFDPIEPVRVRQYYGVAVDEGDDGGYCVDNSSTGVECAVPRLEDGARLPPIGSPVRGGLAALPSDTSDRPEPSWLWLTTLDCGWDGTEGATVCP